MTEQDLLELIKQLLLDNKDDIEVTFKRFKGDYEKPKVRVIRKQTNKGYYNSKNRRNK